MGQSSIADLINDNRACYRQNEDKCTNCLGECFSGFLRVQEFPSFVPSHAIIFRERYILNHFKKN